MLCDTTFVIHLAKEIRRQQTGDAINFLRAHPQTTLHISIITFAEFAEGYSDGQETACRQALSGYQVLGLDEAIAWQVGQLSRQLRAIGAGSGDHDLWIAATALRHQLPLLTADVRHFQRIPGLQMVNY